MLMTNCFTSSPHLFILSKKDFLVIRIILVDDHALVRHGMRQLLANTKEMQIVGEASTGVEAVQLARDLQPSIILLDLKLPDISGLEVTTRLLRLEPMPKILIVSSALHHEFPQRLLEVGVLGYITKEATPEELIQAIKMVNQDQRFISPVIASRVALAKIDHQTKAVFSTLTNKEMEILLLTLRNVTPTEIAKRLHMSAKTVHSYRYRLLQKLDIDNEITLMLLAVREGLITLEEAGV